MKVVLLNTRSKNPEDIQQKCFAPVNLMYLASSLMDNSYPPEIIDANASGLTDDDIVKKINRIQPDLIGISLLSEIFIPSYHLIRNIKKSCPSASIVLGGPHASALPKKVLEEFHDADYVLSGESEKSIVQLCRVLENKTDVRQVRGLYYRENGKIISNEPADKIQNLDEISHPARILLEDEYLDKKYYMILVRQRPVETIITSRGCPYQCRFCCNISSKYRPRSPENVLEEIVQRYEQGITNFDFADANFTFDHNRAMTIFDLIKKEKLNISFRIKSRTNSITKELVKKAKDAGVYLISLGMESGSQKILDRMNKKTKIENNIIACKTVMNAGLKLNTGWIIGFPGETPESIKQTVDLIIQIKPTTANIGVLVPYPGTDVYEEAKSNNTLMGDWSVTADFIPWVKLPWINTYADLEGITRRAKNKVYYRPYYMANFTKEILSNVNVTLGKYLLQETMRSLKP